VYTYTYTPHVAPAYPRTSHVMTHVTHIMHTGERKHIHMSHQHTRSFNKISDLANCDNCYGISCQSLDCVKP